MPVDNPATPKLLHVFREPAHPSGPYLFATRWTGQTGRGTVEMLVIGQFLGWNAASRNSSLCLPEVLRAADGLLSHARINDLRNCPIRTKCSINRRATRERRVICADTPSRRGFCLYFSLMRVWRGLDLGRLSELRSGNRNWKPGGVAGGGRAYTG